MSNRKKAPDALLADRAILIATQEEIEDFSPWYTDGRFEFRFIRVPQFLYSLAATHLRSELRKKKPQPPIVRKSGREMQNKADPRYKEAQRLWGEQFKEASNEAAVSTSMFRGLEIRGGIPPLEDWIDEVMEHFASIGVTEEEAYATYYYDQERLHELWFKKFVILRPAAVMEKFGEFQGGSDNDEDPDEQPFDEEGFAVDMFPADEERDTP